jgi:hypothetical protein
MLDITAIEDALRTWVISVIGIEVIFAHPSAPRPSVPYVLINVYQNVPIGWKESSSVLLIDNSIDITYSGYEEIAVSINTYYGTAYKNATIIKDSLERVTVLEQLFTAGLGYKTSGTVRDIPEIVDLTFEPRAQFDCFFHVRSLDTENVESIQSVELTNELDGSTTIVQKP